jgi:flagellin-like protein
MRRDSVGVSPVIATILLIAITVVAIGAVIAFVSGIGRPTPPLNASISIRNATKNSDKLTIEHNGGDPIRDAFVDNNWNNMEVRKNGALLTSTDNKLNGSHVDNFDFTIGDVLVLKIDRLSSGDVITVIYTPGNQEIARVTVP